MSEISAKYETLIQDLRRDYRPQREWGEGRGLFLVVGHFLVGVAAGAWLFGLIFDYSPGLSAGFLLAGAGGLAHLAFLGRPERFWKMATNVRTSWIARGFIGLAMFLTGAMIYLPSVLVPNWPWGPASMLGRFGWVLAAIGMIALIMYMGFVYSASKAVPFWNSALHPILYVAYSLRGGVAALLVTMAVYGAPAPDAAAMLVEIWIVVTAVVIVLFALDIYGAWGSANAAARRSAHDMLVGRVAAYFYGGTLLVGLVIPAALLSGQIALLNFTLLAIIGVLSALGDFFLKYSTIRAGIYRPLKIRSVR
jgi:sulfite dehydrogenase (quinone) subunit SoeC